MNYSLFMTKLKLSLKSVLVVITRPRYLALAILLAFVFFEIVYWAFNLGILSVVLGSGIGLSDKVLFLLSPFRDIFSTAGALVGILMILVALVQGINLAMLVYTVKHQRRLNAGVIGGGSIAGILAVVGLGCSACGTTLLTPIVAIVVSSSSSAFSIAEGLTVIAPLLAVIVGLVGMYYLGIEIAKINALLKQSEPPKRND